MDRRSFITGSLIGAAAGAAVGAEGGRLYRSLTEPSPLARIKVDPALPKVMLIGDSISIGYTLPVRRLLAGTANVLRPPENALGTDYILQRLARWLGKSSYDVVHFNAGLHDIAREGGGGPAVPPGRYRDNLREIVRRLRPVARTLAFATTTPVPAGAAPRATARDVEDYNRIAREVMAAEGVAVNDLHAFILPHLRGAQRPDDVHFTDLGYTTLGAAVSRFLLPLLGPPGAGSGSGRPEAGGDGGSAAAVSTD